MASDISGAVAFDLAGQVDAFDGLRDPTVVRGHVPSGTDLAAEVNIGIAAYVSDSVIRALGFAVQDAVQVTVRGRAPGTVAGVVRDLRLAIAECRRLARGGAQ